MKKKLFLAGMLGIILAFGVVVAGCGDTGDGGSEGGGGDPVLSGTITISPAGPVTTGTQLTAAYSGSETVSYQWNEGGTAISGETNTTYTPSAAGSYTVTVSAAGYQSKTSAAVTVNAPAAPIKLTPPRPPRRQEPIPEPRR